MANHVSIRRDTFRALIDRFPHRLRLAVRAFWTEALMRANFRDSDNGGGRDGLYLRRGQFVMGRDEMAAELGMTVRSLRTTMKRLENIAEVTTRTTKQGNNYNRNQL